MLATLITRFFQLLFGACVLGLSIAAVKWQVFGSPPATSEYNAFAGACGLLVSLIGIAAVFIDAIPALIMAGIDALASIFFLAGGIAVAVGLSGVHCGMSDTELSSESKNFLINGGKYHGGYGIGSKSELVGRCRKMEADAAFLFLGFIASAAAAALCYVGSRKGSGGLKHSAV
ncbi:marvel domain-containing protein [Teratosphaeria destructans]|uniref:Marvel domain-containing protein n=1 Tax=Teratosphaeria destructans TaxID=418781 RepID=A0A9W7W4Q4_9PEZI|nr:marvel domain-containing protein [Teratosphaeria destructans]